jgi:sphingomyelin phosphodiesterase acid-like 3
MFGRSNKKRMAAGLLNTPRGPDIIRPPSICRVAPRHSAHRAWSLLCQAFSAIGRAPILRFACLVLLCPVGAHSQVPDASSVPFVMLSDIHFDPFYDPAKVRALNDRPVEDWRTILDAPNSRTQATDFGELQKRCKAGKPDAPWPLLSKSLEAQKRAVEKPAFIVISGDLMTHVPGCKFGALLPDENSRAYSAFAVKAIAFIADEIRRTFPSSPVYFALGNNDSNCGDHVREDADSPYLHDLANIFADAILDPANGAGIRKEFPHLGDYVARLPHPMDRTRLIVLQNLFQASKILTCNGEPNAVAAERQISWLRIQLRIARSDHDRVWILAHIPPDIVPSETPDS